MKDQGNLVWIDAVGFEIGFEVSKALFVILFSRSLGVSDKNHRVSRLEDLFSGSCILNLSWNRVEFETEPEAHESSEIKRQKVEKEGPIPLGLQR